MKEIEKLNIFNLLLYIYSIIIIYKNRIIFNIKCDSYNL